MPRPLKPAEIRVLRLLDLGPQGSLTDIAAKAQVSEKAVQRVVASLITMELVRFDAECMHEITPAGRLALAVG